MLYIPEPLSLPEVLWYSLLLNIAIYVLTLAAGRMIRYLYDKKTVVVPRKKMVISWLTIMINTGITVIGYVIWQCGWIHIVPGTWQNTFTDFIVLFLGMDFLMYVFHLLIHRTFLYRAIHGLHHESRDPVPVDLFILHPLETFGFGFLWIALLMLYPAGLYAIIAYLAMNIIFGLAGHLGLEPLSEKVRQNILFRYLGTSSFHHGHHLDIHCNFGFYTTLWDRLFGTWKETNNITNTD